MSFHKNTLVLTEFVIFTFSIVKTINFLPCSNR